MSHESCDTEYESHRVRVEGRTHYKKGPWSLRSWATHPHRQAHLLSKESGPAPPKPMRLPPWPQHLGRSSHPHPRGQYPSETPPEGVHPLPRHKGWFRQLPRVQTSVPPALQKHTLIDGRLGLLLPHRKEMYTRIPRRPWHIRPSLGRDPPGLATITPSLPHLRRPRPLSHPNGRHGLVCG